MRTIANITDDLRSDILAGVFPPGDRLVELQLSERYAVGRASVRSALVELATEGLVDRAANRGATVRRISDRRGDPDHRGAGRAREPDRPPRRSSRDAGRLCRARRHRRPMRVAVADDDASTYSGLNSTLHTEAARDQPPHGRRQPRREPPQPQRPPPVPAGVDAGRSAESVEQHASIVAAVVAHDEEAAAKRDARPPRLGDRRPPPVGRARAGGAVGDDGQVVQRR